jgi:hypothetical protein
MASAVACPEDHIFTPWTNDAVDTWCRKDEVWRTLSGTSLTPSTIQRVFYFVWPERIWLSCVPLARGRLLRQDFRMLGVHLRNGLTTSGEMGLPVTLLFGAPGAWASQLPQLGRSEKDAEKDHLYLAHHPEEFALYSSRLARYGSALRTLRIAVGFCDELSGSARASGALALLFAFVARGYLRRLNHITLVHNGGGGAVGRSFLAPLARPGASALENLRTLRVSFAEPEVPLAHLAALASNGGLRNLQNFSLLGEAYASDADVAHLLRALLHPLHKIKELDLRASNAGVETLQVLVSRIESRHAKCLKIVRLETNLVKDSAHSVLCAQIEAMLISL